MPRITQNHLKRFCQIMAIANVISIIFGICYTISPTYSIAWDIFGVILLATLLSNIFHIYLLDRTIDKSSPAGRHLKRWSYGTLLATILGMICMFGGNFLLSLTYASDIALLAVEYVLVYLGFFGTLGLGLYLAINGVKYWTGETLKERADTASSSPQNTLDRHHRLRIIVILTCLSVLALGGYIIAVVFGGVNLGGMDVMIGIFMPMASIFFAFIMLGAGLFLLNTTRRFHKVRLSYGIGIATIIIAGILFVPPIATVSSTTDAETSFASAFGTNWRDRISPATEAYFLPTRFVVPGYFLGAPLKSCIIEKDVTFYTGTSGVDAGITLKFDAYLPPNNGIGLPGGNSTLIRIHGGAWVIGDKGMGNMLHANDYFAAQGYCVFDVQYGINNVVPNMFSAFAGLTTPASVMGNFTDEDMLRHIGLFCQYLTGHASDYGANLNSVFISGGSAGGQLTCATALGIWSNNYTSLFPTGPSLTIKGYVPFYPANGLTGIFDTTSPEELTNPARLVNSSSPPCLIFHGTHDGLIPPSTAQAFKDAYANAGNTNCSLIWLPFAGHGFDLDYSSYYNQFSLYYMERFLYLYR